MTEHEIHTALVWAMLAMAVTSFTALLWITAPYGRHFKTGWGPAVPARIGWIVMESPAVLLFAWIFMQGTHATETVPVVLLGVWMFHYVYRTLVFPFRLSSSSSPMALSIVVMALAFNSLNAYINARWISEFGTYSDNWLASPAFITGIVVFLLGWSINQHSDAVLLRLRKSGPDDYQVPRGGMYRFVSCPNYLGEIIEWIGWAIAAWSFAGAAFAIFTIANLLPRALANHCWYRDRFAGYPKSRRALIPYLL